MLHTLNVLTSASMIQTSYKHRDTDRAQSPLEINRIHATNKYLTNIKIKDSSRCSFFTYSVETIFHLFWQCPITQIFIKEILSHIKDKYRTTMNINPTNWFLLENLSKIEVLIVILCKSCIHKSRLKSVNWNVDFGRRNASKPEVWGG